MSFRESYTRRPVAEIRAELKRDWVRADTGVGAEYRSGDLLVEQVEWPKPGFKNVTSRGWVLKVGEAQVGPAYHRAIDAMRAADEQM